MACVLLPASLLLAALLLIPEVFGEFIAYQIGLYLIYGVGAQSIGFLWGKTGILPLGQVLFFGLRPMPQLSHCATWKGWQHSLGWRWSQWRSLVFLLLGWPR
jgi:hypothetical protein